MITPQDSARGIVAERAPPGAEALVREAGDELERRIKDGEAARAEEYLGRLPEVAEDAEQALDLIYVEYATRRAMGDTSPREEFFVRFPQWRAQLDRQFRLDELLDEPTLPGASSEGEAARSRHAARGAVSDGRFRILGLLARGGIGQVMRAVDTDLNREVAVKELQSALAENGDVRERFLREAEITGKLEHPGIVPVYGLGWDASGRPFYAMRLVRGQSFQEAVSEFHQRSPNVQRFRGVEFQKLIMRFLHVCETVAFAHSRGIIHRDLKPANILLGPFGETLVVDWGLARATGPEGPQPATTDKLRLCRAADSMTTPVAHWSNELTQVSGELIGTPAFMSPEQAAGAAHDVGPAGDVYSLGATLYMLLTGRAPFVGSEVGETLSRVAAGSFARPRDINRAIPRALEAVCLTAMARRPEGRYASPRGLADDLEHWLADEPVTAAPEPLVARLARWGRRYRTHVVAGSLAMLLITIVSVLAALRIHRERLRADHERDAAIRERAEANRRSARLAFDRGYALTEGQEYGAGMLWFRRALEHLPVDDTAMRRVVLTNLDAARHYLLHRRTIFGDNPHISHVAFSPDGKRLVTTGIRVYARLWDVESGAMLAERRLSGGNVLAVLASDDGRALIAALESTRSVSVQRLPADATAPTEPAIAMRHDEVIACAAFAPDGNVLVTGSGGSGASKIGLWRVSDGARLAEIAHPTSVERIVFRPQSSEIATVGSDGGVRFWVLTDGPAPSCPSSSLGTREFGAPIREIRVASRRVLRIAFTPDGRRILAGDAHGTVSDWDVATGRRLRDSANQSGRVTAIAVASDGQTALAAWDSGIGRLWHLARQAVGCELLHLDRHSDLPAFRPGTRQVLVFNERDKAVLWDIPDPARLAPVLSQRQVTSIAFSPDGTQTITGSRDTTARLRDVGTGAPSQVMKHKAAVNHVAFRPPDGAVVLTASLDGTAQLWNAPNATKRGQAMNHRARRGDQVRVQAAAFSPDGQFVLTGDNTGTIRRWNGDTGELVGTFDKIGSQTGPLGSLCFSPSGARVVAGFALGAVGVWNAQSGKLLWSVSHADRVRTVTFSPHDGRLVLSAGNDETARFWNADDGQPVGAEMRHRGQVFVATFSPDGRLAVTGGYNATVRLWEVPSGRPLGETMRHDGIVVAAAFSKDGARLLTGGSRERTARLWDVATCLPLAPPLKHDDDVFAVAIHPRGHVAFTGRFWRLPAPLRDDPPLVDLWVKLATQRTFTAGDHIEWLAPAALAELAREFEARTGQAWSEWGD